PPLEAQTHHVTGVEAQAGIDGGVLLVLVVEQEGVTGEPAPAESVVGNIEQVILDATAVELGSDAIHLGEVSVVEGDIRNPGIDGGEAVKRLVVLAPPHTANKTLIVEIEPLPAIPQFQAGNAPV